MTKATLGIGTILEYETVPGASPVAYTKVDEVGDIPPLPNTREFVEATNQDSGSSKEYIAGLIDAEQFSIEANMIIGNVSQDAVYTMFVAGTARKWRVRVSNQSPSLTLTFNAIVAAWTPSMPVQGKKNLAFTLRRTGATVKS